MAAAKPPSPAPITIMSSDEEVAEGMIGEFSRRLWERLKTVAFAYKQNIINDLSTLLSALHGRPQAALREDLPTEIPTQPPQLPKRPVEPQRGKEHVKNCGKHRKFGTRR